MALKVLLAAIAVAAIGVGLILPIPHRSEARAGSQIDQIVLRP